MAEIRILRSMRKDIIRNEYERDTIGVASMMDKMRDNKLSKMVWAYEERGNGSNKRGYENEGWRKKETKKKHRLSNMKTAGMLAVYMFNY